MPARLKAGDPAGDAIHRAKVDPIADQPRRNGIDSMVGARARARIFVNNSSPALLTV